MTKSLCATGKVAAAAALVAFAALGTAQAATKPSFGAFATVGTGSAFTGIQGTPPAQLGSSDLVIDVTGVTSAFGIGNAANTVMTFNVTPNVIVDAFAYNVNLTAFAPSWLSELGVSVTNSNGDGVRLNPGFLVEQPGTGSFSDSVLLSGLGIAFPVLADGILRVEFFESFDDPEVSPDGLWNSGTLTLGGVGPIPEPSTYGLMALGMLAVVAAARRRRAD